MIEKDSIDIGGNMIRFDDLDSFASPSVQGISQLERLIDDESLNNEHLTFSGSKDFEFISLFQSEVTHLKSIVSKSSLF